MTAPPTRKANRLLHEKSPYLQQHAYNPVDWYPWGPEALETARRLDRPIFLSIGYSTCHWCHVMAHESFENEDVAALLNAGFVNVKLDREERPDIDALYMASVQMMTGSGGWPMSVWLTPDLKPFYAGTYFPPDERYGRPGFATLIEQLIAVWKEERGRALSSADQVAQLLKETFQKKSPASSTLPLAPEIRASVRASLSSSFDPRDGGFGGAPKFPMPVYLEFLTALHRREGDPEALHMAAHTLQRMIAGGLYDQLGGGFARYSTDATWTVPHFEKMLYDNAQLIGAAALLYRETGDPIFRRAVSQSIDYLNRDLRHPSGGYFSAEDADSEGKEGTFYLWTLAELRSALGEEASLAARFYGVSANGNFVDPHTREVGKNVLVRAQDLATLAAELKEPAEQVEARLESLRERLFALRSKRLRPHRDEKILTEWNGLAIHGLALAGRALKEASYLQMATATAAFIRTHLYDESNGALYRRWRDGDRAIEGNLADYAMLVQGLLQLFAETTDPAHLAWATALHERQNRLFFDPDAGAYYTSAGSPDLLLRMKEEGDNVIPSGNAVAARNGLKLAKWLGRDDLYTPARRTLEAYAEPLRMHAASLTAMALALDEEQRAFPQVVIVGPKTDARVTELAERARAAVPPEAPVWIIEPGHHQRSVAAVLPFTEAMSAVENSPSAFVCENFVCRTPTKDPAEMERQIRRGTKAGA